ncbi:hypothetical protein DFP72DRAFT_1098147 [Ephemerocybe angulata]|uniref:Uncharacterized protein n=1 Tax=Ephemerocybe angulata TaxID=980116 RepID=A0A8H6LVJ8_9AGAR|nr:hypothetical protein DFP72DRAFT_1098147 [Tulosesus angulatus]
MSSSSRFKLINELPWLTDVFFQTWESHSGLADRTLFPPICTRINIPCVFEEFKAVLLQFQARDFTSPVYDSLFYGIRETHTIKLPLQVGTRGLALVNCDNGFEENFGEKMHWGNRASAASSSIPFSQMADMPTSSPGMMFPGEEIYTQFLPYSGTSGGAQTMPTSISASDYATGGDFQTFINRTSLAMLDSASPPISSVKARKKRKRSTQDTAETGIGRFRHDTLQRYSEFQLDFSQGIALNDILESGVGLGESIQAQYGALSGMDLDEPTGSYRSLPTTDLDHLTSVHDSASGMDLDGTPFSNEGALCCPKVASLEPLGQIIEVIDLTLEQAEAPIAEDLSRSVAENDQQESHTVKEGFFPVCNVIPDDKGLCPVEGVFHSAFERQWFLHILSAAQNELSHRPCKRVVTMCQILGSASSQPMIFKNYRRTPFSNCCGIATCLSIHIQQPQG